MASWQAVPARPVEPSLHNDVVVWVESAGGAERLVAGSSRRIDRLLARWRARSLDEQLAAGEPPEGRRLRAVRAAVLVTTASREAVATWWEDVLDRADRAPSLASSQVPVVRTHVAAAGDDIADLIRALRAPRPVAGRGVATAKLLLADGRGPLYNPASPIALAQAVRAAQRRLQPTSNQLVLR